MQYRSLAARLISIRSHFLCITLVASCATVIAQTGSHQLYLDPSKPVDQRVSDLIGRLTLEEKAELLPSLTPCRMRVARSTTAEPRVLTRHRLVYRSPVINLARDPRWGRIQEIFSEDPYPTGEMGCSVRDYLS
jgi:beta-glucosidase